MLIQEVSFDDIACTPRAVSGNINDKMRNKCGKNGFKNITSILKLVLTVWLKLA